MNERRDDLSTADLAAQQPTDTAPPDRTEGTGFERRDVTADDPGREERRPDNLPRDAAVLEDRVADVEPGRDPLRQDQDGAAEVGVDQELAPVPNGAPAAQVAPDSGSADTTSTAGPLLASEVPTDDLRTAFQRYRSFFERLLAT